MLLLCPVDEGASEWENLKAARILIFQRGHCAHSHGEREEERWWIEHENGIKGGDRRIEKRSHKETVKVDENWNMSAKASEARFVADIKKILFIHFYTDFVFSALLYDMVKNSPTTELILGYKKQLVKSKYHKFLWNF